MSHTTAAESHVPSPHEHAAEQAGVAVWVPFWLPLLDLSESQIRVLARIVSWFERRSTGQGSRTKLWAPDAAAGGVRTRWLAGSGDELAEQLGLARSTVYHTLAGIERRGLIRSQLNDAGEKFIRPLARPLCGELTTALRGRGGNWDRIADTAARESVIEQVDEGKRPEPDDWYSTLTRALLAKHGWGYLVDAAVFEAAGDQPGPARLLAYLRHRQRQQAGEAVAASGGYLGRELNVSPKTVERWIADLVGRGAIAAGVARRRAARTGRRGTRLVQHFEVAERLLHISVIDNGARPPARPPEAPPRAEKTHAAEAADDGRWPARDLDAARSVYRAYVIELDQTRAPGQRRCDAPDGGTIDEAFDELDEPRRRKLVRLGVMLRDRGIDPLYYVHLRFVEARDRSATGVKGGAFEPPGYTELASGQSLEKFREAAGGRADHLRARLRAEGNSAKAAVRQMQQWCPGTGQAEAWRRVLGGRGNGLSALFRVCMAHQLIQRVGDQPGLRQVMEDFEERAAIDYLRQRPAFEQAWGDLLPDGFGNRAQNVICNLYRMEGLDDE